MTSSKLLSLGKFLAWNILATLILLGIINLLCWFYLAVIAPEVEDETQQQYIDQTFNLHRDLDDYRLRLIALEYHSETLNVDAEGWRVDKNTA